MDWERMSQRIFKPLKWLTIDYSPHPEERSFLERAHTLFQPDEQRDEDQARIAELEQLLGRATRQIEILKKASTLLDAASTRNGR